MIRKMNEKDRNIFLAMTEAFYHSEAVLHPIAFACHEATFDELMRSDIYLNGYIFEIDEKTAGYSLISKSFSPEVGGMIIWIEEIYILSEFRSKGLGRELFDFLYETFGQTVKRFRLEVERSNEKAVALYERLDFTELGYYQMIKDFGDE